MTDALDNLISDVADGLAADAKQARHDLSDALYQRLDEDATTLQARANHEKALQDQLREAEAEREAAYERYHATQHICKLAKMLGLLDPRDTND